MNIYFDPLGQQVQSQFETGRNPNGRLNGLFAAIESAGWSYTAEDASTDLTAKELDGYQVLVLTNRMTQGYAPSELGVIVDFVRNGGGLWCMSNHGSQSVDPLNCHMRFDSAVACCFFITFQASAYFPQIPGAQVDLPSENLNIDQPNIQGRTNGPLAPQSSSVTVSTLATRSFCGVYQNDFTTLIANLDHLQNTAKNGQTRQNMPQSPTVVWAVSIEDESITGQGRAVFGADAGWLGDTDSDWPGPGEFQNGDNPQYALNALAWLGRFEST